MVLINIVMQIKAECQMNAQKNDGFSKGCTKGSCSKSDSDGGDRCRRELVHWKGREFAVKWYHQLVDGVYWSVAYIATVVAE
jgi:hypothetical protein